jgi:ribose/xylose/arabinose/galactoside ABC-type transport system permease subunit
MKTALFTIGGFCAALAGILVFTRREQPVVELAHRLEEAWADHHTTV